MLALNQTSTAPVCKGATASFICETDTAPGLLNWYISTNETKQTFGRFAEIDDKIEAGNATFTLVQKYKYMMRTRYVSTAELRNVTNGTWIKCGDETNNITRYLNISSEYMKF